MSGHSKRRRPDWRVALAMLAGGLPGFLVAGFATASSWPLAGSVALGVVVFFIGAFGGGVLATRGERRG